MKDDKLKTFSKVDLVRDSEGIIERISKDDPKKTGILMTREQADELNSQQHNSKVLFKEEDVVYKLEDFRAGADSKGQGGKLIRMFVPDYEAKKTGRPKSTDQDVPKSN